MIQKADRDSSPESRSVSASPLALDQLPERSRLREERLRWGELAERPWLQQLASEAQAAILAESPGTLDELFNQAQQHSGPLAVLAVLTFLRDRRWDPGQRRRAEVLSRIDRQIDCLLDRIPGPNSEAKGDLLRLTWDDRGITDHRLSPQGAAALVVDARGFPPEGDDAMCRLVVRGYRAGWRQIIVYRCHGDRFLGCGLGPASQGLRLDIFGSAGDYLGSGLDGAEIYVHGNAQDQIGQILKSGRIVIFGDVGQTLLYGDKGGEVFILGQRRRPAAD